MFPKGLYECFDLDNSCETRGVDIGITYSFQHSNMLKFQHVNKKYTHLFIEIFYKVKNLTCKKKLRMKKIVTWK